MSIFGYMRVSSKEQNEDRQVIALAEYQIPKRNIYMDKKSGKDFQRPAYKRMVKRLKKGDLLILKSIDRLGRNYEEIIEQWRILTRDRGVDIKVIDMPLLDTTHAKDILGTFIADLVLQVLSYCAHSERENIRQRQAEGIAAAKARGVKFGKPRKDLPDDFKEIFEAWREGRMTSQELAGRCDMALGVIYRKMRESGGYEVRSYRRSLPERV